MEIAVCSMCFMYIELHAMYNWCWLVTQVWLHCGKQHVIASSVFQVCCARRAKNCLHCAHQHSARFTLSSLHVCTVLSLVPPPAAEALLKST